MLQLLSYNQVNFAHINLVNLGNIGALNRTLINKKSNNFWFCLKRKD